MNLHVDAIVKKKLPTIKDIKKRYSIKFNNHAILLWHPVTSKLKTLKEDTNKFKKLSAEELAHYS